MISRPSFLTSTKSAVVLVSDDASGMFLCVASQGYKQLLTGKIMFSCSLHKHVSLSRFVGCCTKNGRSMKRDCMRS